MNRLNHMGTRKARGQGMSEYIASMVLSAQAAMATKKSEAKLGLENFSEAAAIK